MVEANAVSYEQYFHQLGCDRIHLNDNKHEFCCVFSSVLGIIAIFDIIFRRIFC